MAVHTNSRITTAALWPDLFGRIADIPAPAPRPDADLLTLCVDFRRLNAALGATPDTDGPALDAAWEARQQVAERLMTMRPVTEAGRREKAAVGVTIMNEVAGWQRDSEVLFALAAFAAECV